ncbi:KOW domain-containing RNA-binding protein [Caldanaerobacter subterraneus]|uniref:Ribosomal protein L14E (/ type) n=2 Tax=Caldanaerobacter subterraneus TaxID=911092 RepID=U5CSA0_CALSX|nr:KOW domain-containing RNA-binding protein [Caldanaerobacter subterraneus]ERM91002.1 ribosomal protein L14E (/ type) [Caldanaerobacter subterraneus subsp. yonseiensis KB-1]NNG66232.1 RNA-binding protein [Caldanaerobacter subterraneus]
MDDLQLGQIVRSKAGRDKGRIFVVVGKIDEQHVLIADGDLRKIEKPKKKKYKHLQRYNEVLNEVREKLKRGESLTNEEIRRLLEPYKS